MYGKKGARPVCRKGEAPRAARPGAARQTRWSKPREGEGGASAGRGRSQRKSAVTHNFVRRSTVTTLHSRGGALPTVAPTHVPTVHASGSCRAAAARDALGRAAMLGRARRSPPPAFGGGAHLACTRRITRERGAGGWGRGPRAFSKSSSASTLYSATCPRARPVGPHPRPPPRARGAGGDELFVRRSTVRRGISKGGRLERREWSWSGGTRRPSSSRGVDTPRD